MADERNTILSELDLSFNNIQGFDNGNHLHGLLLTLPHLNKLNVDDTGWIQVVHIPTFLMGFLQ